MTMPIKAICINVAPKEQREFFSLACFSFKQKGLLLLALRFALCICVRPASGRSDKQKSKNHQKEPEPKQAQKAAPGQSVRVEQLSNKNMQGDNLAQQKLWRIASVAM